MVYLITYDLNRPGKNYASLYSALERLEYIKDTNLDSVWFISSTSSAAAIYEYLRVHLDKNDRLFVTKLNSGEYFGWMHPNVWSWVLARL